MIIKTAILLVWILVVPAALGMLPMRLMRRNHRTPVMLWICGWIIMTAIFQAVSIPVIINQMSFAFLKVLYTRIVLVAAFISFAAGLYLSKDNLKGFSVNLPDREHIFIIGAVVLLIILQLSAMVYFAYPDGDDAFYIGTSLTTIHTDSMYIYSPYNGDSSPMDVRHALSPVPIFMAWLSEISGVHVTILCHEIMGCVFLLLMYAVFLELGRSLFRDQKRNCWLFLFFVNLLYLFGNISIYTPESFAFTRAWQGKSMFACIIVPMLFYYLLAILRDDMDLGEWLILPLLSMTAVFTTSTAVFMVPMIMMLGCVFHMIQKKEFRITAKVMPCMLPCAVYGLLYLMLQ